MLRIFSDLWRTRPNLTQFQKEQYFQLKTMRLDDSLDERSEFLTTMNEITVSNPGTSTLEILLRTLGLGLN